MLSAFLIARLLVAVVGFALSWVATMMLGLPGGWVLLAGIASAFADQIVDFVQAALAGLKKDSHAALCIVLQRIIPFGFFTVSYLIETNINYSLRAYFVGSIASIPICLLLLSDYLSRPKGFRIVTNAFWGFWLAGLSSSLPQLQPVAAGLALGPTSAGMYSASSRVANPLSIVSAAVQSIMVPRMASGSPESGEAIFRRSLRAVLCYSCVVVAISPAIAWVFIKLLGSGYEGAQSLVTSFVVGAAISSIAQVYQADLLARYRPGAGAVITGASTAFGLGFLWFVATLLSPSYLWAVPIAMYSVALGSFCLYRKWLNSHDLVNQELRRFYGLTNPKLMKGGQ
nr:hypothetical protein [Rhodococcus sp. 06-418-1B]